MTTEAQGNSKATRKVQLFTDPSKNKAVTQRVMADPKVDKALSEAVIAESEARKAEAEGRKNQGAIDAGYYTVAEQYRKRAEDYFHEAEKKYKEAEAAFEGYQAAIKSCEEQEKKFKELSVEASARLGQVEIREAALEQAELEFATRLEELTEREFELETIIKERIDASLAEKSNEQLETAARLEEKSKSLNKESRNLASVKKQWAQFLYDESDKRMWNPKEASFINKLLAQLGVR